MSRNPPKSTLFPTRRSSDLNREPLDFAHHQRGGGAALQHVRRPWPAGVLGGAKQIALGYEDGGHCAAPSTRSEEHTSELQSHSDLVCRLLLEKKKMK